MKLTQAEVGILMRLAYHGPAIAVEVIWPRDKNGKRKVTLQWDGTRKATLDRMCNAGWITVSPKPMSPAVKTTDDKGNIRTWIVIDITEAGRVALDKS